MIKIYKMPIYHLNYKIKILPKKMDLSVLPEITFNIKIKYYKFLILKFKKKKNYS
jgi:hypothetical protein